MLDKDTILDILEMELESSLSSIGIQITKTARDSLQLNLGKLRGTADPFLVLEFQAHQNRIEIFGSCKSVSKWNYYSPFAVCLWLLRSLIDSSKTIELSSYDKGRSFKLTLMIQDYQQAGEVAARLAGFLSINPAIVDLSRSGSANISWSLAKDFKYLSTGDLLESLLSKQILVENKILDKSLMDKSTYRFQIETSFKIMLTPFFRSPKVRSKIKSELSITGSGKDNFKGSVTIKDLVLDIHAHGGSYKGSLVVPLNLRDTIPSEYFTSSNPCVSIILDSIARLHQTLDFNSQDPPQMDIQNYKITLILNGMVHVDPIGNATIETDVARQLAADTNSINVPLPDGTYIFYSKELVNAYRLSFIPEIINFEDRLIESLITLNKWETRFYKQLAELDWELPFSD